MNFLARSEKLLSKVNSSNIDGFVSFKYESRRYASGFAGSAGIILLIPNPILLVDFRYTERAKIEAPWIEVKEYQRPYHKYLKEILLERNIKKLGFESNHISVSQFKELKDEIDFVEWIPFTGFVEDERLIKDEDEIHNIKTAQMITEEVLSEVVSSYLVPGVKEIDIAIELEYRLKRRGAEGVAFPIIVASGKNSALPHAQSSNKIIEKGDLVVIDIGSRVNGYVSDCTRTYSIGKPGENEKKIYYSVLESQLKAIEAVKEGMEAWEVDNISRSYLKELSLDNYFGHGLGHGVGLEVHESPKIAMEEKTVLKENMVFTIEPGVYIPDWGGVRIEDMVVVRKNEVENLTLLSKEEWIL